MSAAEPWGYRIGALAPASYAPSPRAGDNLDASDLAGQRFAIVGELPDAAPFSHVIRTAAGTLYLAELRPLQRV